MNVILLIPLSYLEIIDLNTLKLPQMVLLRDITKRILNGIGLQSELIEWTKSWKLRLKKLGQ